MSCCLRLRLRRVAPHPTHQRGAHRSHRQILKRDRVRTPKRHCNMPHPAASAPFGPRSASCDPRAPFLASVARRGGPFRGAPITPPRINPIRRRAWKKRQEGHRHLYWQQTPDGSITIGGFRDRAGPSEWSPDARPTEPVQSMLETFMRRHPGVHAPITHRWAASAAFSDNDLPILEHVRDGI